MINEKKIEFSENSKLLYNSKLSMIFKVSLIIAIILIPPVFLMEHSVKYPLYFFTLILTGLMILFIFGRNFEFRLSFPSLKIIDYFLLGSSLMVLTFSFFPNILVEIPLVLSFIVSFFLSGWVFTRLLSIEKSDVNLGLIVIAFSLSVGLTAVLFFLTLITDTLSVLPYVFVGLAFLPLIKDRLRKNKNNFYKNFEEVKRKQSVYDLLVILWIISFFVFFLANIYPKIIDVPGTDILRHFLFTNQHILNPDFYGSIYPWFHHIWGTVIQLSSSSMIPFLIGMPVMGFFLFLSFYVMSKEYLKDFNRRAHLLATIFFSVFSGFGWIYFIHNKLTSDLQPFSLVFERVFLSAARDVSWWDIGTGHSVWMIMTFRPFTVAFILFFVILYLMKRHDLSMRNFIIIMFFLGLTLAQFHVPGLVILSPICFGAIIETS